MERVVLGLDIGGANLKAATSSGRAKSVPFAVWKQPDRLSAELRMLIGQFPEASELAVTMTAELCDCYETKRAGVRRIVEDVQAANPLPMRVWSTEGKFVTSAEATANPMIVAAANWHALATFAGRYSMDYGALLIDIGSTTTDIIPIEYGVLNTVGLTDSQRLGVGELVYQGWRRTPATTLLGPDYAAELFATSLDAYLILGLVTEKPEDTDTADGRPATRHFARARLSRMMCGDPDEFTEECILDLAGKMHERQMTAINRAIDELSILNLSNRFIISGSGAFLLDNRFDDEHTIRLDALLGAELSSCAPAYAVATLFKEVV